MQLFSHCYISQPNVQELLKISPGAHRFPERALALAGPSDIVLVKDPVDPVYISYLAGLCPVPEPDRIVVADPSAANPPDMPLARQVASNPHVIKRICGLVEKTRDETVLSFYIFNEAEHDLARLLVSASGRKLRAAGGSASVVAEANQKHLVRLKALELGVPVAPGEIVQVPAGANDRRDLSGLERAIRTWLPVTGRVIIRGSVGASGSSTFIVGGEPETWDRALSEIRNRADNNTYLVEAMFPLTVSPNICLFIDPVDGEISCQSVTDQILLGEVSYNGNSFPSRARTLDRILASARVLAEWFRGRGLTGYVGFDFCEYETPGGAAGFFLAEINPRVNGAIYATALMNKMNSGMTQAFMTKFARPPSRSFSELCDLLRGRLFDPRTGTGIVPYNTGCLPYGRCILAVFGQSLDQVRTLASEALP